METFIVICLEHNEGYVLATRQIFLTRESADAYAQTINASREPIVVAGRWNQLRLLS